MRNRKCTSKGNITVDMDTFPCFISVTLARLFFFFSILIMLGFFMNTEGLTCEKFMKILKQVRPLPILIPNFRNTNGSVGYRQTFQMSIKSTNDVSFLQ